MRYKWFVCLALLSTVLWQTGDLSRAQAPSSIETIVKESLASLVAELQIKFDRQAAGDQSAYDPQGPINPGLKAVGRPVQVLLSAPVPAQGLLNFSGRVFHENGSSDWTLSTLSNGQIVAYIYAITRVGAQVQTDPSVNNFSRFNQGPGWANRQIFGGDNAIVRNPSELWSRAPAVPAGPPNQTPPQPVVDPRVVEFLFASTRRQTVRPPTENASFSGERAPLTFGAASVRIPDDHKIGRIELPSSWSLFGINLSSAPNEREHFIIKRVVPLTESVFNQVVRAKDVHAALIFVHGFNTTFEDALYRNAQIIWDLQYTGLSVLFTWASRGDIADYIYDKESAYLARDALIALIVKLKRDYGIEQVNVLAHSMGNLIAVDGLANYARTSNPVQIARLLMAAPDVDRDLFLALTPIAETIVGGMTLYASSQDRAMIASRALAGGVPRAGDVPFDGPVILPNVETIDVSAVGQDIFGLNHNVFASSRDVMEDISAVLRLNQPPPRLIQIRAVPEPPALPRYWKYVP